MKKSELLAIEEEINLANDTLELQEFGFLNDATTFQIPLAMEDARIRLEWAKRYGQEW